MPYLQTDLYSEVMSRYVCADIALPEGSREKIPVLFMLHGSAEGESYRQYRGLIARYANETGIAVVMPETGFDLQRDLPSDENYSRYVSNELVRSARRLLPALSDSGEDTFVGGISVGAYGAMECLMNGTNTFSAAICLPDLSIEQPSTNAEDIKRSETDSILSRKFETFLSDAEMSGKRVYIACGAENALLTLNHKIWKQCKCEIICRDLTDEPGRPSRDHELLQAMRWLREGRE